METYENKYGFIITAHERVDEIDGTVVEMLHEKSGARLIFLDRKDENTTFCIAFKTTPTDDTGVFHIIEHSVLCGSKKFPVKDPFNELTKGSLYTYLNALTSGDKTLYPVSSKNTKSFRGLVDVYLDAVFNPLAMENPYIFMQEGHRYEFDEDGDLCITGVVYNEMQGVYSTADDYADYMISAMLQPGGTYAYDSGGHPDFITDLTYEQFKETHKKFYHPSNSYIFLDGDVNLDEILPLIDSYLCVYDKREVNFEITDGEAPMTDTVWGTYPIDEDEDPTDKTRIFLAYNSFDFHDGEKNSALSIVTESIADLNVSPLTARILNTGLCEGFTFYNTSGYKTNALHVTFTGVKEGKEEELIAKYDEALADLLNEGLSKETLESCLKRREFLIREADSGSYPRGMVYMRACINSAILGEPVTEALRYEPLFEFLYGKLNTDYYKEALIEVISSPRSTLILRPDPQFTAKKEEQLFKKLDAIADAMTEEDKARLTAESEAFRNWQKTPDSPEKLATLPTLSIKDIDPEYKQTPTEIVEVDGTTVVSHPIHTGGIAYTDMYFDVSDATEEDVHYLRLFCDTNALWDTAKSTSAEFRAKIKKHLGAFYITLVPIKRGKQTKLYLMLNHTCLDNEKDNAIELLNEYMSSTLYNNSERLKQYVKQSYTAGLESMSIYGSSMASMRCAARYSPYDAISEHISGYEYYRFIKNLAENIDTLADDVLAILKSFNAKYFKRERLTLGITEIGGVEYAKRLLEIIPTGGKKSGPCKIKPIEKINEAIAIPGSISFTAMGSHLCTVGEKLYTGAYLVYDAITTHELLWNEIRAKNGAYGTEYFTTPSGIFSSTSYRDPTPNLSLKYYSQIPDKITDFLNTSPTLDKYIIGVFGESDTVTTPRASGTLATKRFLSDAKHEKFIKRRLQCLNTSNDDLTRINTVVKEALKHSTFTVVAPRDELEKIEGIDRILEL